MWHKFIKYFLSPWGSCGSGPEDRVATEMMLNISKLCAGLSTSRLEGGDGPDLTFWTRSWASLWSVVSSQSLGIQRQGLREFSEDLPQAYAEQESRGTA